MKVHTVYNRRNKTGKATIDIYVFVKRNDFTFISTGVMVESQFFDHRTGLVSMKHTKHETHNQVIRSMIRRAEDFELSCIRQGLLFTAADVRHHLKADQTLSENMNQFMWNQLELDAVQLSEGRIKQCRSMLKNFDAFGMYTFNQFDQNVLRKYHAHLRQTMQETTTPKNHKLIKKYLSRAVKMRLTDFNPYDHFKIPAAREKRVYLTSDELNLIRQYKGHPRLEKIRDVFLFMCLTGISFTDMANLTIDMIEKHENDYFIIAKRQKTEVRQMTFLLPEAIDLIKRYAGKQNLFPSISNQKMNAYLKEIAAVCNIRKDLTSHVARHTFATIMLTRGMPLETIQNMLGHADIKTTAIYAELISSKISNDFKRLGIDSI